MRSDEDPWGEHGCSENRELSQVLYSEKRDEGTVAARDRYVPSPTAFGLKGRSTVRDETVLSSDGMTKKLSECEGDV